MTLTLFHWFPPTKEPTALELELRSPKPASDGFFTLLFVCLFLADPAVGAEPGEVQHGPLQDALLPGQPAGRRAAKPKEPAGHRQPPKQSHPGAPGDVLRLLLSRTGKQKTKKTSQPAGWRIKQRAFCPVEFLDNFFYLFIFKRVASITLKIF